jgi:hypothetical protein
VDGTELHQVKVVGNVLKVLFSFGSTTATTCSWLSAAPLVGAPIS